MMQFLMSLIHPLTKKDERGASAVEYGLLVAGIAAVVVAGVFLLGGVVDTAFTGTKTCIDAKAGATC